jgi:hypothetical protein
MMALCARLQINSSTRVVAAAMERPIFSPFTIRLEGHSGTIYFIRARDEKFPAVPLSERLAAVSHNLQRRNRKLSHGEVIRRCRE